MSATPPLLRTPAQARALAKDAYVFGYGAVENYRILHAYFVNRAHREYKGPWNELHHESRVCTPLDRVTQSVSAEVAYSRIAADLRAEPLVISVPTIRDGRLLMLQFIDLHTHNFGYAGSRASGNDGGSILLAGPDWHGRKPAGIKTLLRCETRLALVLMRLQLFHDFEWDEVRRIQSACRVQPLSSFLAEPPPDASAIEFPPPLSGDRQRNAEEFFGILNFLLRFCPVHASEKELMERFARLGIGAGAPFDAAALSPDVRLALDEGISDAWRAHAEVRRRANAGEVGSMDLYGSRENLRNNYLYRMAGVVDGIYGNSKEEALYCSYFVDSIGDRLDGANHRYALHFARDALPPAFGFWSVTIYDLPARTLSANALGRHLISDSMLPRLARDSDGGITLHMQHDSPGRDRQNNWLPAPLGPFFVRMRLYWPKQAALDGSWQPPPMRRIS